MSHPEVASSPTAQAALRAPAPMTGTSSRPRPAAPGPSAFIPAPAVGRDRPGKGPGDIHQFASLDGDHPVGQGEDGRTVRNDQGAAPFEGVAQALQNPGLGRLVKVHGGLVQEVESPGAQEDPGQGDALAFAGRDRAAAITELSGQAFAQAVDQVGRSGLVQGAGQVRFPGLGVGQAQVGGQRGSQEGRVLGQVSNELAPRGQVAAGEIIPAHGDGARTG